MTKTTKATIEVQGATITVVPHEGHDFISLTDIAKYKNPDHPDDVVRNWLRNLSTVEFLGIWERLNNPDFNPVEFDGIRIARHQQLRADPKAMGREDRRGRYSVQCWSIWWHLRS